MSVTLTTNYGLSKPDFNTEFETWWGYLNTDFDLIDAQMKVNANAAAAAQTTANGKANTSHTHPQSDITNLATDLALKATVASPAFSGTPTAPTAAGGTNTIQIATTAFVTAAVAAVGGGGSSGGDVNTYTGSTTLVSGDANDFLVMNSASANSVTVPPNASVAFAIGTEITIGQYGAGQTTIVAGSGVTIRTATSLLLSGQYAVAKIKKIGTNEWWAFPYMELGGSP